MFNNSDWLASVVETAIEPEREIVDPHHHLWPSAQMGYNVPEFRGDLLSGHNVVETVFMECGASYRKDGPDHLKPVGETEFVVASAEKMRAMGGPYIAALVAHADLRLPNLDEVLDAQEAAGKGMFRGIRHAGSRDESGATLRIPGHAPPRLYHEADFQRGVKRLGQRGLSYDTWHYHHQNRDYLALAQACPDTLMVLDHFGTPVGVGPYADKREEIFAAWKEDVTAIAKCPNVYAKIGGLAMPDNGFGWDARETPATSDEIVAAHERWYDHMIACFGPERCMFESNFPVDRLSMSYVVYWNAMKKIAAKYSEAEKAAMFAGTARKVYKL
ncbi:MAG: amidohydrolase family protein [Hyphomonas sp.]|nr:amidohydrolase family protein [Hyphomonas sp.]